MKKFLMALTVALALIGGNVAAAKITDEQLANILLQTAQVESTKPLDAIAFQDRFNWLIAPIIRDDMNIEDASAMEYFFTIKDFNVSDVAGGKIYSYIFGYPGGAVVGIRATEEENFKVLSLCYTTPESTDEAVFTIWLMKAFVGSIAPNVDARDLMNELTAEGAAGCVVKDGVKFTITDDGNLNILTAVAQ